MKRIILMVSVALMLAAFAVNAQVPTDGQNSITLADGTNNVGYVAASTFTNYTAVKIDAGHMRNVTLQITYAADAAGGASDFFVLHYRPSVDGVTFSSASTPIILPPIGVTNRTIITNIDSFGARFIRVGVSNASGTANITNQSIIYGVKISAP